MPSVSKQGAPSPPQECRFCLMMHHFFPLLCWAGRSILQLETDWPLLFRLCWAEVPLYLLWTKKVRIPHIWKLFQTGGVRYNFSVSRGDICQFGWSVRVLGWVGHIACFPYLDWRQNENIHLPFLSICFDCHVLKLDVHACACKKRMYSFSPFWISLHMHIPQKMCSMERL